MNNRIPDAIGFKRRGLIDLTPNMGNAGKNHFRIQQECDEKFTSEITALRDYYVEAVARSANDQCTTGQNAMAFRIKANAVIIHWESGKWIDTMHLTADGQRLTGTNQWGNQVSGARVVNQD